MNHLDCGCGLGGGLDCNGNDTNCPFVVSSIWSNDTLLVLCCLWMLFLSFSWQFKCIMSGVQCDTFAHRVKWKCDSQCERGIQLSRAMNDADIIHDAIQKTGDGSITWHLVLLMFIMDIRIVLIFFRLGMGIQCFIWSQLRGIFFYLFSFLF